MRVIDLGCGAGPVLSELRRDGVDVVGLDYSGDMLDNARSRLRSMGLSDSNLFQGDCRHVPYPAASFDLVVCLGVISYLEHYESVLEEIHRLLKPGGTALISFRNVFNPILSDPLALIRRGLRIMLSPIIGPRPAEKFEIGRLLDHRVVRSKLDAAGLDCVNHVGIGFGPFCFAGRKLFNERRSIRISRWLAKTFDALAVCRPRVWLADVSLFVCQRPARSCAK
jgi:SAM-dependent methyltransferase